MNELVERVVAQMAAVDRSLWEDDSCLEQIARMVIEAMRVPTEDMCDTPQVECGEYIISHKACFKVWQAMIDAALVPQT